MTGGYFFSGGSPVGSGGAYAAASSAGTVGLAFTTSAAVPLDGLWQYSPSGNTQLPTEIGLWTYTTLTTGTLVASNSSPSWLTGPGGSAAAAGSGWVYAAFSSPYSLSTGVTYVATMFRNSTSAWFAYQGTAAWPGTVSPLTAASGTGNQGYANTTTTTSMAYPNTSYGFAFGIDLQITTGTNATVAGVVATSTPAAPAGSVSAGATTAGAVGTSALAGPAGSVHAGATIAGAVAPTALAAPAGAVVIGVGPAGPVATSAIAAPAGAVSASSAVAGPVAASALAAAAGTVGGTPEVFPDVSLGLAAELQVNSVWTSVVDYMDHGPVVIGRGHPDESTTVSPSTLEMTLTNTTGDLTSQNPVSPFYPWLKPNIPLRVSIPASSPYLRLENDSASNVTCPASTAIEISGDIDIQIEVRPSSYVASTLAARYDGGSWSWVWLLNGDGTQTLWWIDTGSADHIVSSTVPIPFGHIALRVTLQVSTGTVTWWTAPEIGGAWTQLGPASVTGATTLTGGTSPIEIGYSAAYDSGGQYDWQGLNGAVFAFQLLNGIGGTAVASPQFTAQTAGATSFADAQGNTWTLNGTSEISDRDYRGHFEVPEWPQSEPAYQPDDDEPEIDVLCAIAGGGLLRRYGQANTPVLSPMRRAYTRLSATALASAPAAYWPGEDLAGSSQLASGIAGPPMYFSGTPTLASSTAFACSAALPAVNGAVLQGAVPAIAGSWSANVVRFLMQVPSGGEVNGTVIASVVTTGTVALLQLVYGTGGTLNLIGYSAAGSQLFATGADPFLVNGALLRVSMELTTSGSAVQYVTATLAPGAASAGTSIPATLASASVGAVTNVILNPGGGLTSTILGHCSVQPAWDTLFDTSGALEAWLAEPAGIRFQRLCGEEGIAFRGRGNLAATIEMGAQTIETLSQLLQECADADRGVWYETRKCLGWGYVTRQALYNQAAAVTLDHDQDHLSPWTSDPTQDDQTLLNDATITATAGSSARAYAAPGQPVTGGRLSNLKPPAGIGVYDSVPTSSVNTANDSDLQQIASWMIHLGTVDQQRFPGVSIDLANTAFPYFAQTVAMDLGDRFVMVNPPPWLGPDPVSQLCQGLKETLWAFDYLIEVNGVPETPYEVAQESAAHADTDGTTLQSGASSTAASLSFATASGYPLWSVNSGDYPCGVKIAGELVTVTAMSGASSPQTAAVIRSVNGVVKAQLSGAPVNVYPSPVAGL